MVSIEHLSHQLEQNTQVKERQEDELKELRKDVEQLRDQIKELEKDKIQLQIENQNSNQKNISLEGQNGELTNSLNETNANLKQLMSQHEELKDKWQADSSELGLCKERIQTLTTELEGIKEEATKQREKKTTLKGFFKTSEEQV